MERYTVQNFTTIKQYKKEWAKSNSKKLNDQQNSRYKNDINYRLSVTIRNRITKRLKGKLNSGSFVKALGCTVSELRLHLELQFKPGMSWSNHGKYGWHIDHIKPLCTFDLTDKKQLAIAGHFSNLRPLWAKENLTRKKRI